MNQSKKFARQERVIRKFGQRYDYRNIPFLVTPELGYFGTLQKVAKKYRIVVVGGFKTKEGVGTTLIDVDGRLLDHRYKAIYPPFNPINLTKKTDKIRVFNYKNKIRILPIVCYEIIFPMLWMKETFKPVDFVTHHVGFPMFDVFQLEGWKALHQSAVKFFGCDVITACGGDRLTPMNISGILRKKDRHIFDYSHLYKNDYTGGHI